MNAPKRKGTDWERRVADYAAQQYGLPWDRAPLRGTRDLLDIQGCLPDGWLVGCKALGRQAELVDGNGMSGLSKRLSEGMKQCDQAAENMQYGDLDRANKLRAVVNLHPFPPDGVVPVQVVQRSGYPVGQAYVVMTYDRFLRLVLERRAWDAWERGDD